MELTGKANIEFIKWYQKNIDINKLTAVQFRNMPNNVQWGVFLDFFIDKGLSILIDSNHSGWFYEIDKINGTYIEDCSEEKEDINEVRKDALKAANEIYNAN